MATFNINDLQPVLPDFSLVDVLPGGKVYVANKSIFAPATRVTLTKLRLEMLKHAEGTEEARAATDTWLDFVDTVVPGLKADKVFDEGSDVPTWAQIGIVKWLSSHVYNTPIIDDSMKYSHEDAERLLDHLITEKAGKELLTPDEMRTQLEGEVFEKK